MKFLRSKHGLAVIAAVLLLFLFRPGVGQLRKKISGSLGSALGRKVTIDAVRIHLLPRPGFGLDGLVVYDDPAFSDEPMMRAQDVSAAIRLRSLFRGRIEIATLSANEPSINLVRNEQGRWNLASLLERSAHTSSAPTGQRADGGRPAFPYLEASHARINFKLGQAKKSWSLADADVTLWQDSENSWGARMIAQPIRTDFNLTDTGRILVNATWQRAATLSETPMNVSLRWENGQLGQLTKLFSGRDRGWRGDLNFNAALSGTPKSLQVNTQWRIDDFRRYDILGNEKIRLSATCSASYSSADRKFETLDCEAPVSSGSLRMTGNLRLKTVPPSYDLTFAAEKVPLTAALPLLRQVKKDLPADLVATGQLDAGFRAIAAESGSVEVSGKGVAADVHLSWNREKEQVQFGDIPFALESNAVKESSGKPGSKNTNVGALDARLAVGPIPLAMGTPSPAIASGWLSASGYRFQLEGDTEIKHLYRLASALGVSAFHPTADGSVRVDVGISGSWQGFEPPAIVGTAQLQNVRTGMRGLNPSIEIASAIVKLDSNLVSLENLSATVGDTHWSGNVKAPRPCAPGSCLFQFDLSADTLSSIELLEWFTPHPAERPWYRILDLSDQQGKSPLLAVRARGRFRLGQLTWNKVDATEIATRVDLDRGKIILSDLHGQIFHGLEQGNLVIDASVQPPRYEAKGLLQGFALAQASSASGEAWATGTADANFDLASSGKTLPDLLAHTDGELHVTMRNGSFTYLGLPDGAGPFPVHAFTANVKVKSGSWKLTAGTLDSHDGVYRVSGTVSPAAGLNLVFTRGDDLSWNVTGTALKPKVVHTNRTEARSIAKP